MNVLSILVIRVLNVFLYVLQDLMFLRAILSWIPSLQHSFITNFVIGLTEPFISPVRNFMDKLGFSAAIPIDLSFIATYLLLMLIQGLLPNV